MGKNPTEKGTWYNIKYKKACPICGNKDGRCGFLEDNNGEIVLYRCKYMPSSKPSGEWFIHYVKEIQEDTIKQKMQELARQKSENADSLSSSAVITPEILKIRDKGYRYLRELRKKYYGTYLDEEDLKDLHEKRGLSLEMIDKALYFSTFNDDKFVWKGQRKKKVQYAIMEDLYEIMGKDMLQIAGVESVKGRYGNFFVFKPPSTGYYIPYINRDNQVVGMQIRLRTPIVEVVEKMENGIKVQKEKKVRYFFVSSKKCSSGSPVHKVEPVTLKYDGVIVNTEGATKGNIVGDRLGVVTYANAGISNYKRLFKNVVQYEQEQGRKYVQLIAYDMNTAEDSQESINDLKKCKTALYDLYKKSGHLVFETVWDADDYGDNSVGDKSKGIDDATLNKTPIYIINREDKKFKMRIEDFLNYASSLPVEEFSKSESEDKVSKVTVIKSAETTERVPKEEVIIKEIEKPPTVKEAENKGNRLIVTPIKRYHAPPPERRISQIKIDTSRGKPIDVGNQESKVKAKSILENYEESGIQRPSLDDTPIIIGEYVDISLEALNISQQPRAMPSHIVTEDELVIRTLYENVHYNPHNDDDANNNTFHKNYVFIPKNQDTGKKQSNVNNVESGYDRVVVKEVAPMFAKIKVNAEKKLEGVKVKVMEKLRSLKT